MKRILLTTVLVVLASASDAFAQGAAAPPQPAAAENPALTANRALGDVTEIDAAGKMIVLKVDKVAHAVAAALADNTQYYRAKPEALARAESGKITAADLDKITFADIGVGDRVIVLGRTSDDRRAVLARTVIVAKKADIAGKHERDREEWRRRGTLGTVASVDAAAKTITITTRTPEGPKPVTIEAGGPAASFRRYPPGSVKYAETQPSNFSEVRIGDQLRVLGERSADGARVTPEIVAFGSFRTLIAKVVSVDAANKVLKVNDEQNKRELQVSLVPDSTVRRMPEMMSMMFARMAAGGGPGMGGGRFGAPGGGQGGGRPEGRPEGGQRPQGGGPPQGGEGQGGGGGQRRMMMGGRGFDVQEMIEQLPQVQLAELKPGDVVIVASTVGSDPARATAITILTGAEPILLAMQSGAGRQGRQGVSVSSGLPGGLDELGIGIP
jgi:hypothetical protein